MSSHVFPEFFFLQAERYIERTIIALVGVNLYTAVSILEELPFSFAMFSNDFGDQ